jgi:broad specificity phosphatase PhoE
LQVTRVLEHQGELVLGTETGAEALARFSASLDQVLADNAGNLAVVTHGTVLSLFVSRLAGVDPVAFWGQLELPAYVVFAIPELRLLQVVYRLPPNH